MSFISNNDSFLRLKGLGISYRFWTPPKLLPENVVHISLNCSRVFQINSEAVLRGVFNISNLLALVDMAHPASLDSSEYEATTRAIAIPEIQILIMQNLDPLSMLMFMSSLPAALHTYLEYPRILLGATIDALPAGARNWARALLHIVVVAPCTVPAAECTNPGFCWLHIDPNDEHDLFLELFSKSPPGHRWPSILDRADRPLIFLKKLADVQEAIGTIVSSDIWSSLSRNDYDPSIVTLELWRYEVYCVAFRYAPESSFVHKRRADAPANLVKASKTLFDHLEKHVAEANLRAFKPVFRGLSHFLAKTYKERLPTIFEAAYLEATEQWGQWSFEGNRTAWAVMMNTESRYRTLIDDLLSQGVSFIAQPLLSTFDIRRMKIVAGYTGLDVAVRAFPVWRLLYTVGAGDHGRNEAHFDGLSWILMDFNLKPTADERPGYRLSLAWEDATYYAWKIVMDCEQVLLARKITLPCVVGVEEQFADDFGNSTRD